MNGLSFDIFSFDAVEISSGVNFEACSGILAEIMTISFDHNHELSWSAAEIGALLRNPGVVALVVSKDDHPIGFLMSRSAGREVEILSICIMPVYRGKTIGHQVMRHFRDQVKKTGGQEIFLEVNEHNARALALYKKNGFKVVGRRRQYYGGLGRLKQDALIMKYLVK